MAPFGRRFAVAYVGQILAFYVAIGLISITGVWRNNFLHTSDNLLTAMLFAIPNSLFGAKAYRKVAIAIFFTGLLLFIVVLIAITYREIGQELLLFWPVWVSLALAFLTATFAYTPGILILDRAFEQLGGASHE